MRTRVFLPLIASIALSGCISTYSAPRTIPRGAFRSYLIADAVVPDVGKDGGFPPAVRYMGRLGLGDREDIGIQVSPFSVGIDAKWNPLRGPIDFAIAPEADGYYAPYVVTGDHGEFGVRFLLPLLIGWNVHEAVTVLIASGPVAQSWQCATGADCTGDTWAFFERIGGGFNLRLHRKFAMQPEVNVLRSFREERYTSDWHAYAGIGFAFGESAEYNADE